MIPFDFLKKLYKASPFFVQRIYSAIPFSVRAGKVYRKTLSENRAMEKETAEVIDRVQQDRLFNLLKHCKQQVAWYREFLNESGIDIKKFDSREVLERFPIVDKKTLAQHPDLFRALHVNEPIYKDNTGGSSGSPLAFWKNNSMYPIEIASINHLWERVGYRPGDRKITLRGRSFTGEKLDRRWAYNPIYNELALSTYHLDPNTLSATMPFVRKFAPSFIHGYPSAVVEFLRVLEGAGLEAPRNIKAVLCGSEPLYDYQRSYISARLGCRTYSWYGQSECVLLGGECEHSSEYHMLPLYGITELVDGNDRPITQPGVEGEIIGTSLTNYAMPFVRYRTGDRGVFGAGECACGRSHIRLSQVTGRKQYYVVTYNGTSVPVTAFVFGQHFLAFERIRGMQLVQDEPGRLLVRIVRGSDYSLQDEKEIMSKMQNCVDQQLSVVFQYLERLPTNGAGKVDFVVQNVKQSASFSCQLSETTRETSPH
jgi:phenylacetate-CoA ligase